MTDLPFNLEIIKSIAEFRQDQPILTGIFKFFTFMGDAEGYIIIAAVLYWLVNKKKAFKATIVAIVSVILTDTLKELIRNPRPFVTDGTQSTYWALDPSSVLGFSTPSGHALISAAFWGYLALKFPSRRNTALAFFMSLMIGLSRPFLGVHYFEDIFLGWTLGIIIANLMYSYEFRIYDYFERFTFEQKITMVVVLTHFTWLIPGVLTGYDIQTTGFATGAGLLNGILVGHIIEYEYIKFNSKANNLTNGLLRYILGLIVVAIFLYGLDILFELITKDDTFIGYFLRYIRYSVVALVAFAVVPYLYLKFNLSNRE